MLNEGSTFGINTSLVLILVKQTGNFASVYIIMLIRVICLLMEKKSLSLKPTIKMLTFHVSFSSEVYLIDLVLLTLKEFFEWRRV